MSGYLSTALAAELAGLTPAGFRREMSRQRARGNDFRLPGPDARTPLWDEAALRAWLKSRPGPGNRRKPAGPNQ